MQIEIAKPDSATVRQRLKAATDGIHLELHTAEAFSAIAAGTISLADYGVLLQRLRAFHRNALPLCRVAARALDAGILATLEDERLARLDNDIRYLEPVLSDFAAPDVPSISNEPFCMGYLYTVQGSTLGGKVISSQLETLLPSGFGRRFFAGSPDDGKYWRLLCTQFEIRLGAEQMPAAIEGARFGFEHFRSCLNAPLVPSGELLRQ